MAPRISVVINTLNEEVNLPYALRSVHSWADEIIVVDMYSEDRTVEIARGFGANVFLHERIGFADPARAFAIAQTTGDWVFILDADEIIPAQLSRKCQEIARDDRVDIVNLPRLNYLLGSALLHTGWGPEQDRQMRFFRRGFLCTTATIHDFLKPLSTARVFDLPYRSGLAIVHFQYPDVTHFIEKLNRYTTIEARQAFERGASSTFVRASLFAAVEFGLRYFKAGGFRDGWRGFYLSWFMAIYRLAMYAKLKELQTTGEAEKVIHLYHQEAERLLNVY